MKVKTHLQAGKNNPNWEKEWQRCQAQVNDLTGKIASLEAALAVPVYPSYTPGYYPPNANAGYPVVGQCPSTWQQGVIASTSGGGYYGEILGQDGAGHYFNNNYTQFFPNGQSVVQGQSVLYAPFPAGNERAGKAACISATYLAP